MSLDLLAFLIRTLVVGLVATALLWALRRSSAARLHAVAAAALMATLLLIPASLVFTRALPPVVTTPVDAVFVSRLMSAPIASKRVSVPAMPAIVGAAPNPMPRPTPVSVNLTLLWAAVSAILVVRLLGGLLLLGSRLRRAQVITLRPGLTAYVDARAALPSAVWWGRPVVILPSNWQTWTPERLETVLRHERSHLHRGDCWTQLAGSLACAAAWPNPLIWWLSKRARSLAEHAVDDSVLESGVPAAAYAQDLLDIARYGRKKVRSLELPMATPKGVEARIRMIMNVSKQRGSITLGAVALLGIGFSGLAVGASAWSFAPQSVEAAIAKSMPASVSRSLKTLDPLSGTARVDSDPLTLADQSAPLRSTGSGHGQSWDQIAPSQGAESPNPSPQATAAPSLPAARAGVADTLGRIQVTAQLYGIDAGAADLPKQFGTWSSPTVQQTDMDAFLQAIHAAGGQLMRSTQLIRRASDGSPTPEQPDDAKLGFLGSDPTDGSFVVRLLVPNPPAAPTGLVARLRPDERVVIPVQGDDPAHHKIWVFRLLEDPAAGGDDQTPRQQAAGTQPIPTRHFQLHGFLYWLNKDAAPPAKHFGSWLRPIVSDKEIDAYQEAIRKAGGKMEAISGYSDRPLGANGSTWEMFQGGKPPTFEANPRMDGSVEVTIHVPNREGAYKDVIVANLRQGQHVVASLNPRDGVHRAIWIFQLAEIADAMALYRHLVESAPPPAEPDEPGEILFREQHLFVAHLPAQMKIVGRTAAIQTPDGEQEWTMSSAQVKSLVAQLDKAGAVHLVSPVLRTTVGHPASTSEEGPQGRTTVIIASIDSARFFRTEIELKLSKTAPPVKHSVLRRLPAGLSRVLIIPGASGSREVFIFSAEPE